MHLGDVVLNSLCTSNNSVSDVSDNIGNYVVSIDRPQPNALIYVGVFGVDLKLIPTGENYYFSIEVSKMSMSWSAMRPLSRNDIASLSAR